MICFHALTPEYKKKCKDCLGYNEYNCYFFCFWTKIVKICKNGLPDFTNQSDGSREIR